MAGRKESFDAPELLRVINGAIVILILLMYSMFHEAFYVDGLTFLLGAILALQVHIALGRKGPADPFVIVLLLYITVYYTFRVVTLAFYDTSDVFRRFPYFPSDTNYALTFIIACNGFMLYGFSLMRKQVGLSVEAIPAKGRDDTSYLPSLLVALSLSTAATISGLFDYISDLNNALRVLIFFLRPTSLFIFIGVYFVAYYQKIPIRYFYAYFLISALYTLYLINSGTRGYIIYLVETFLILLIANEKFSLNRKILKKILVLAPLGVVILFYSYNFATLQRDTADAMGNRLHRALVYDKGTLAHIFSRVGFLDMSAEIIAHQSQYKSIFNAPFYVKSIINNFLTPGFDYDDTPKISHSLIFKHENLNGGEPSKSYLYKNNIYHSDQLGFYGEMYALFGLLSLPILFFFAYALKWSYYYFFPSPDRFETLLRSEVPPINSLPRVTYN